jgi:hypothetical protein
MRLTLLHTDGDNAWYRLHILEKNYSVEASEDPFGELQILHIRSEWNGGKSVARNVPAGPEFDKIAAAFLTAKASGKT